MKSHQGDMPLKYKQHTQQTLSFSSLCSTESLCLHLLYSSLLMGPSDCFVVLSITPWNCSLSFIYIYIIVSIKLRYISDLVP